MKLKSIFTNSFGILLSRIFGFLRDVVMASVLGASYWSDIFFLANRLPNLFRNIFAEGAFTQAFMPSFVASRQKGVFSTAIFLRFSLFIIFGSLVVTFAPEFITKLQALGWDATRIADTAPLTAINFWYLYLIFIVTFIATLLQYKEHFVTTAMSTVLLNLSMIVALLIFMKDDPKTIAYALSISVLVGGALQVLVHLIALHKLKLTRLLVGGWKYRKHKNTQEEKKKFTKLFIPAVWGGSSMQINSFVSTILASFLITGSVSYLAYAQRLFQLPLGLFAIATATALFPSISKALKNNDEQTAYSNLDKGFWLLSFLLGFATLGGMLLSQPIIWLLFERNQFNALQTVATAEVLSMFMLGLLPLGLAKLFSLFLYASYRQGQAAKIATISVVVNIVASLLLMKPMGASGLALAGSIGGWVLFILTVKEVGVDRFMAIVKSKKSFYFVVAMFIFSLLIYFLNSWILTLIR
ncbi:MAG: Proposed peptidoglycan lipid II flippase MurJ [uncultured Sulfurovum sp.]|uniref:Probable lipid II flippase MurJ n=1 Tax=uncultured Sulfurovum sp. TaxID=269237 RepID=A0A6S6UI65_9BACT|nr:MAG: Proposed peptidoglycan lipid II flippase MurJ [uncultured Sulfurovum sp.]